MPTNESEFQTRNHGSFMPMRMKATARLVLTVVRAEVQEPFPPGSLKKYITPERDAEMLELLKGCSLEIPDEKAV